MNKYFNSSLTIEFIHSFNLSFDLTNVNSSVFKFNIPDDITIHKYTCPSNIKLSDDFNKLTVFAFFYLHVLVKNNLITHNQIPAFLHSIHAFHSSSHQNLISYFFDNYENIHSAYENLHSKISKKTTKTNDEIISNIGSVTNSNNIDTTEKTCQNSSDGNLSENSKPKTKKLKIKKKSDNITNTAIIMENMNISKNVIDNIHDNVIDNIHDKVIDNHVIINTTDNNIKIKFKKPRTKKN